MHTYNEVVTQDRRDNKYIRVAINLEKIVLRWKACVLSICFIWTM